MLMAVAEFFLFFSLIPSFVLSEFRRFLQFLLIVMLTGCHYKVSLNSIECFCSDVRGCYSITDLLITDGLAQVCVCF